MRLWVLVTLALLHQPALAQNDICWGVDGTPWTSNKRCPGSSTCCGADATCMPNRLCKNKGQAVDEFVRGPCAVKPYSKEKCAAICVYEEVNNRFPRVKRCEDGSYCCDNDSGCCDAGRGVFIDDEGNPEGSTKEKETTSSEAPETTTSSIASTTSAPSSTSTSSVASTTSTDSSPSSDAEEQNNDKESDASDDDMGLKIGLVVGIPAAAIGAALAVWLFLRKKRASADQPKPYLPEYAPAYPDMYQQRPPQMYQYQQQQQPVYQSYAEMDGRRDSKAPGAVQELQG
ncbi:hypothetical protein NCS57_00466600 [Fusarium keratoplasticum]|uniref:Uncharacterized protein n=1 Tax=Fusarium keratoplasticum TaxID=1328300 RepID=A0ACC0R627_9HYPO|nr:hypothetical protein NCS57_00466600 [Fusarium keratoplasticum]KAI8675648.1 hypothetical protein NCS57_00466600 [Fusarium keratoplasticum]